MKQFFLSSVAAITLGLAATATTASPVVGTIPGAASANNEVIAPLTIIEGWYGASVYLIGTADIEVTLIGYEARNTNTFSMGGQDLVGGGGTNGTLGSPIGTMFTLTGVSPGLLGFSFTTNGLSIGNVVNGSNVQPNQNQGNYFVTFAGDDNYLSIDTTVDGSSPGAGKVVWLFYDDLGAGPDDNHDDLVVRLAIKGDGGGFSVPEPGSLALIGVALLGVGAARRRRQA